ncbi:MAG: Gfo/Idh/MocA family protein [Candidatus Acidiferrales bacterium]
MKILVIGCGSIGRRHARNLRWLGVADVVLYDANCELAACLADELGFTAVETLDRAYEEHPDAALICAPTSLHLKLALYSLRQGCHLFVEKPLSHSMEGVDEFLVEQRMREKLLMVGYNFRFDPLLQKVRRWVGEGRVGAVVSARFHFGSCLPFRHPWEDYRVGYGARASLGGGVILDASHELDLALWIFGQPETIYCAGGKYSDLEIDVEDVAEILLSYPDKTVSIHLDYVQSPAERWCEFLGNRGQIRADLFARTLRHFNGGTRAWNAVNVNSTLDDTYKDEMKHFLDCLNGRAKPAVDGQIAAKSLALVENAKKSVQGRLPISLSEINVGAR